jgi:4'-phosphopantetheinyl transferase
MKRSMKPSMKISDPRFRIEEPIPLPGDEVHLWQVELERTAEGEADWARILCPQERARAARFHFSKDRKYYTATRAILRIILGAYLGVNPEDLRLRYSQKEKPALDGAHAGTIEFNVSHSGNIALLAFARGRALGVDVEQIREQADREAIVRRFFSEHEQQELAGLAPEQRCAGFFRCWTRKEAYIKATGDGLSLPLHQFDVSVRPGDESALLATRPDASEAERWSLREVEAGVGYAAALCVRGQGWTLKS